MRSGVKTDDPGIAEKQTQLRRIDMLAVELRNADDREDLVFVGLRLGSLADVQDIFERQRVQLVGIRYRSKQLLGRRSLDMQPRISLA